MARRDALFDGTSLFGRAQTKSYLLYIKNGNVIQTNSRSISNISLYRSFKKSKNSKNLVHF